MDDKPCCSYIVKSEDEHDQKQNHIKMIDDESCSYIEKKVEIKKEPGTSIVKSEVEDDQMQEAEVEIEKHPGTSIVKSEVEDDQMQEAEPCEYKSNQNTNQFGIPDMPEDYKETYQAYIEQVQALASVPISESITPEYKKNYKFFNLRYYDDRYSINFMKEEAGFNDILVRIHTNKLFLISLASGNDIIRSGRNITAINFIINNSDRSEVKLGGKRKKGAKMIGPKTILCQVKCEGISKLFNIRAGVAGRILEINEQVMKNPDLLRTDPKGNGFLAVIAPKGHPSNYDCIIENLKLLTEDEYVNYLSERDTKLSKT